MTENEAIRALKDINLSRVHPFYSWEGMVEVRGIAIKALEEIQKYRALGTAEELREAMEKQKAKKPITKPWSPALCPSCGCELSESLGDGYYKHLVGLEVCPKCFQRLDWSGKE